MAPLPSRKSLESMKRVDLQKICKDYGVRANLKSEALIDLLLDTQSTPPPQPARRSVSTRLSSTKAGPSRVSSMIVHDISEEEDDADPENPPPEEENPTILPNRTRKAKELQTRLGVGKPVVAGGQGPRAVTRSSGSSRARLAKSSRSLKPIESTIEEESETGSATVKVNQEGSPSSHDPQISIQTANTTSNGHERVNVQRLIEDAIHPLHAQIRTLTLEVDQIQTIKSDIAGLQMQVADVCKAQEDLHAEFAALHDLSELVVSLKDEIKQLREGVPLNHAPSTPSTPKSKTGQGKQFIGFGLPSAFRNSTVPLPSGGRNSQSLPGVAQSTLGKRHRGSTESDITGVVEEGQEDEYSENELTKKVIRPTKKRPRMAKDGDSTVGMSQIASSSRVLLDPEDDEPQIDSSSSNRVVPTFTVFRSSEEPSDFIDPPPPTDHLPDFFQEEFPPNSNPRGTRSTSGVPTSSANAVENQPHPFGFSFLPTSSVLQSSMYMPSFPYPEPPQSPSPAGPSTGTFLGRHHDERTDIFKSFGLPSPLRSTSRRYGSLQEDRGGFVNPAALSQETSSRQREPSSNDVAAGLGLTAVRTASSSETTSELIADAPTSKRTMYGTELESDTRFGDFGVEGVASGFWTNGKF
ncbi:hypothetical protein GALMADRAFT_233763 [Galerina marginata CBS 339.88]|uniref:Uncharacterized protein n=1 Tax=Galerina marginata (strain CBS 339.88) TaxID=685588 RepID=A0A067TPM7_GALM3|nr:hypothetical protein GALMADRAFT_233763 [Galerina marginata CBS 339.88]